MNVVSKVSENHKADWTKHPGKKSSWGLEGGGEEMTGKHGDLTQDEDVLSRDLEGLDVSRYTCHFCLSCVSMPECVLVYICYLHASF